jgi:hypothetical protein
MLCERSYDPLIAKPTVETSDKVRLNLEKFVWSSFGCSAFSDELRELAARAFALVDVAAPLASTLCLRASIRFGSFPPPALPGFNGRTTLSDSRRCRRPKRRRGRYPRTKRVSPDYPNHLSNVPCPLPRRIERVRMSIASPHHAAFPEGSS